MLEGEEMLFLDIHSVITATRRTQPITEAPATIDIITAEDIRISGAITLAELLERLPGIYTPTALNGLEMLLYQGVAQFEMWTGEKAPVEIMRKALLEAIEKKK